MHASEPSNISPASAAEVSQQQGQGRGQGRTRVAPTRALIRLLFWMSGWIFVTLQINLLIGWSIPAVSGLTLGIMWWVGPGRGIVLSGSSVLISIGLLAAIRFLLDSWDKDFWLTTGLLAAGQWLIGIVSMLGLQAALKICRHSQGQRDATLARRMRMVWLVALYAVSLGIAGPMGALMNYFFNLKMSTSLLHTLSSSLLAFVLSALALVIFAPYSQSYLSGGWLGPSRLPSSYKRAPISAWRSLDLSSGIFLIVVTSIPFLFKRFDGLQLVGPLSLLYIPIVVWTAIRCSALTTHHVLIAATFTGLIGRSILELGLQDGSAVLTETLMLIFVMVLIGHLLQALSTDRRMAFAKLEQQALRDPQTDLLNERGLLESIAYFLNKFEPSETNSGFGLICAYFPTLQQLLPLVGRERSPALLTDILHRLSGKDCQAIARLDSQHFICVTHGKTNDAVAALAQALSSRFEGLRAGLASGSVAIPSVIGGLHLPLPLDSTPESVLLALQQNIDVAASRRLHCHTSTISAASIDRWREHTHAVEFVRSAIMEKRVELFAQRIVSNRIPDRGIYCEVLARLRDPVRGILMPAEFLPIAQANGLMSALDRVVIAKTFNWFATQPAALRNTYLCTINLSAASLSDEELLSYIEHEQQKWGISAQKFGFEITEGETILDQRLAVEIVDELRVKGFKVAIDDFGTGLATFDYLKRFHVDTLKIDGAFIRNLDKDALDQEIVLSIVRVAQRLGIKTVAEFVTSPDLHRQVMRIGIDYSQGFALGMPMPLEELMNEQDDATGSAQATVFGGTVLPR